MKRIVVCLVSSLFILFFASTPLIASEIWKIKVKDKTIDVEIAKTENEQRMGLGNRFSLAEGRGMLFIYDKPGNRVFWMKRMFFPIDIIWLLQGRIVHIEKDVPPPNPGTRDSELRLYGRGYVADMVLEVPAGYARKNFLNQGDTMEIVGR